MLQIRPDRERKKIGKRHNLEEKCKACKQECRSKEVEKTARGFGYQIMMISGNMSRTILPDNGEWSELINPNDCGAVHRADIPSATCQLLQSPTRSPPELPTWLLDALLLSFHQTQCHKRSSHPSHCFFARHSFHEPETTVGVIDRWSLANPSLFPSVVKKKRRENRLARLFLFLSALRKTRACALYIHIRLQVHKLLLFFLKETVDCVRQLNCKHQHKLFEC